MCLPKILMYCHATCTGPNRRDENEKLLDRQESAMWDWLGDNGDTPVDVVVCRVEDDDDPPSHQQVLRMLDRGYQIVLVESFRHIARGVVLFDFLQRAERQKVRVVAVNDHFDSNALDAPFVTAMVMMRDCPTRRRQGRH